MPSGRVTQPIHPVTRTVARNVRAHRKQRGLTAEVLARAMTERGVYMRRSVLANLEAGRRENVTVAELAVFAQIFGATASELMGEPSPCAVCCGFPPGGFTCNACGAGRPV